MDLGFRAGGGDYGAVFGQVPTDVLSRLTRVARLDLAGCWMASLAGIESLEALESLNLCGAVSDPAVFEVLGRLRRLRSVIVDAYTEVDHQDALAAFKVARPDVDLRVEP